MTGEIARKFKSRRWLLQVSFNILAGINTYILHKKAAGEKLLRQAFSLQLREKLTTEYEKEQ